MGVWRWLGISKNGVEKIKQSEHFQKVCLNSLLCIESARDQYLSLISNHIVEEKYQISYKL